MEGSEDMDDMTTAELNHISRISQNSLKLQRKIQKKPQKLYVTVK